MSVNTENMVMNAYQYGEAYACLKKLCARLKRLKDVAPSRDVSTSDVKATVKNALTTRSGRRDGVFSCIAAHENEPFAQVLLIVEFLRHYERILLGWVGPSGKRDDFLYAMNGARHLLARFDAPCKYEQLGACTNSNCPYAHMPSFEERVRLLPTEDQLFCAMIS